MSTRAIQNAPANAFAAMLRPAEAQQSARVARSDVQPAIQELEALRLDGDVAAPADVSELFGPLVALYKGEGQSGDHLRLPRMTNLDGPQLRGALLRVLSVDTSRAGGSEEEVVKEAKMRRVLAALERTVSDIHRKSAIGGRE